MRDGTFQAGGAFACELQVGGGLDETVVSPVQQVLAECFETLADLSQLLGRLLLAAIGLGEAALKSLILSLEIGDDLLKLFRGRRLSHAHLGSGQQPEGGGKCLEMEAGAHEREGVNRIGLFLADTAVCLEQAGRGEFTQFMANHVFGHVNGNEGLAIVHGEVVADEIRGDHRLAAPCFDGLAVGSGFGDGIDLGEKLLIDVWAFFE